MILIILLLLSSICHGAIILEYRDKPIIVDVSKDFNRIGFSYSHIKEIIGDKNQCEFSILSNGEVSFFPKTKFGTKLDFAFITDTGVVQDLKFIVQDIEPQSLMVNIPLPNHYISKTLHTITQDIFLKKILHNQLQFNPQKDQWHKLGQFKVKNIGFFIDGKYIAQVIDVINFNKNELQNAFKDYTIYIYDQSLNKKIRIILIKSHD